MSKQAMWSGDQLATVRSTVQEEAARARIGASFLAHYGPLEPGARFVTKQSLETITNATPPPKQQLAVDELPGVYDLVTLAVNVTVRSSQMAEPGLQSALQMFRRAANVLARLEDAIVFNGQAGRGQAPGSPAPAVQPEIYTVSGGDAYPSLLWPGGPKGSRTTVKVAQPKGDLGQDLVTATAKAVGELEAKGHLGPFVCVLDQEFFVAANTPNAGSMVLPSDRMTPFLSEAPLRSSTLPAKSGVVVSLAGDPIDIAVASDLDVKFLQVTTDNTYVFRVSEKFALRVKDPDAVVVLT